MVESKDLGIGIGIGIVIGIALTFSFVAFAGMNQGTTLDVIPALVHDEPKLASLQASYFDDTDRLVVALILTDKNAEYATADGTLSLFVQKDGREIYSTKREFEKDDFLSWKNPLTGEKVTGYRVDVNQFFSSGSHDVFVNMVTTSGTTWEGLHATFYSLE